MRGVKSRQSTYLLPAVQRAPRHPPSRHSESWSRGAAGAEARTMIRRQRTPPGPPSSYPWPATSLGIPHHRERLAERSRMPNTATTAVNARRLTESRHGQHLSTGTEPRRGISNDRAQRAMGNDGQPRSCGGEATPHPRLSARGGRTRWPCVRPGDAFAVVKPSPASGDARGEGTCILLRDEAGEEGCRGCGPDGFRGYMSAFILRR